MFEVITDVICVIVTCYKMHSVSMAILLLWRL